MPTDDSLAPGLAVPFLCVPHLLEHQAMRIPEAPAIMGLNRAPLSYRRLYHHIETMGRTLRAMGIHRHDRVAVVLPNGPELPVAILTVAAHAICAPTNPAFGLDELDGYFADLRPDALITLAGTDTPARRVAIKRGIRVIDLSVASDAEAGVFTLAGDQGRAAVDEPVSADHTALLLPTSGTTSRPKIVLQRHAGVCASAHAHRAALALGEADRCLNVLPLFHGHGLTGTVVASLAAGASVVCTPGFDTNRFSGWLAEFQPTWFSAVPTMHQAIIAQARHTGERMAERRLRFVRSSSASLPPSVFAELECTFESPVIEWYGMTEVTSSPIACNPLPPRPRKPGSVGVPVALDVAIMDERGTLLGGGRTGEVVVRGASVTRGYDGNMQATAAAFVDGWFKTGDLGYFDADGYLFLVGRSREMINRGGEKVAPVEIDDVLLGHPAVAEAVTFAVPHATLGEDVASAVVLRPDAAATPKDIRKFATGRMAEFKVPRQVFIVRTIPKGPTGKVQRVGLAAKLGLEGSDRVAARAVAPRTPIEETLARIWKEVLQRERIGVDDDFFAMGGDSLLAVRVLVRLQQILDVDVEISRLFEAPTIAEMAEHIETLIQARQGLRPPGIARTLRENGTAPASIAQESLWQLHHALPDMPLFNVLYPLRLTSAVDPAVLERSINEIVQRHEILRTTFALVDGRCLQVIAPRLMVSLRFDDLHNGRKSWKESTVRKIVEEELLHSFDLAKGPLIRLRLVQVAEEEHLLLISMHQIICDGWSLGIFIEELAAMYETLSAGAEPPMPPPSIQYADFARWQRDWRSYPDIVAQLTYWQGQLRAPLPPTGLAGADPRRTIDDLRTARREWALPASLADAAKRFSHQEGGTLFMALVAALNALLHLQFGQDDVRVATNVANRNRAGTETLIGPLVNTVILRTNLEGDPTAQEVLRRVRATTLAAFARQDLAFENLVENLDCESAMEPAALSNVMILLQNATLRPLARSGRRLIFEEANPSALMPLVTVTKFGIILALTEGPMGLTGTCVYKPHTFAAQTIDRLLRQFEEVLAQMTVHPERPISAIRLAEERVSNA